MLINTDTQPQSFENTHPTTETGEMHETEKVKQKTWSNTLLQEFMVQKLIPRTSNKIDLKALQTMHIHPY